jgi:cytochrome c oxidase assembly protein subunit 15
MDPTTHSKHSPWPHRLAVVLALVTFPLIWVGGLVTTYDAGMAVPDWPGTYGYNLFAYPLSTWIAGPWDLFIEHGHRLLGATAGLVAIALVVAICLADRRPWMIRLACGALALVIVQGLLGGARVLMDERLVALLHACVGPLFFAYLAGLIVVTSQWWTSQPTGSSARVGSLSRSAWSMAGLAFGQLMLGAVLRHIPLDSSPGLFRAVLLMHLVAAGALALQIGLTLWSAQGTNQLSRPAGLLAGLVVVQVSLGVATYVAKYSWPAWLGDYAFAANYVVQEKSLTQSLITTAHVALGSLILFVSALLAMRATRVACVPNSHAGFAGDVYSTEYSVLSTQCLVNIS